MEVVQLDDPLEAGRQVAILFEHPLILLADRLLDSGDLAAGRTVGFRSGGGAGLSASAFPLSMGVVGRNSHAVVARAEWLAWRNHLRDGGRVRRVPAYSDCAIQHPSGVEGFDPKLMQVSATVRYTLSESWLLIKGESTRRNPARLQFPRLAKQLVYGHLRDRFHGKPHCQGCTSIKAAADGQPGFGSAEAWRRIGTVHHIAEVTQTLRSLPES